MGFIKEMKKHIVKDMPLYIMMFIIGIFDIIGFFTILFYLAK
jgi:hypothetical protein